MLQLEEEIVGLKKRLDDLRKAKNTTVLKREREILEVGTPFGRRSLLFSVSLSLSLFNSFFSLYYDNKKGYLTYFL